MLLDDQGNLLWNAVKESLLLQKRIIQQTLEVPFSGRFTSQKGDTRLSFPFSLVSGRTFTQ